MKISLQVHRIELLIDKSFLFSKSKDFKNSPFVCLLCDEERVGASEEFGGAPAGLYTVGQAELQ